MSAKVSVQNGSASPLSKNVSRLQHLANQFDSAIISHNPDVNTKKFQESQSSLDVSIFIIQFAGK